MAINGTLVLENFDIVSVAGANQAVVREFKPVANSDGQIVVSFITVVDNAKLSALELIPPANVAPLTTEPVKQINSGGEAVGSFGADQLVTGGLTYGGNNPITTSGVAHAAPAEVYQSERFGDFSYTLSGLIPTALYVVRLHFAEIAFGAEGSRVFNVAINEAPVLQYFDIYSVAGANTAVVRDFSAIASPAGQIVVSFESVIDNAKVSGLELLKPVPQSTPSLPGRSIGAGRHPLVAGCNAVAVAYSEQTDESPALYLSTFQSAGQPLYSVQIAQTKVSTPDPGVAALPGDDFVVAWADFDDDELGISLSKVVGGVAQGKTIVANEDSAFSQSESDIVFDGNELVVAWKDSHDAVNGPDLRYRLFTPDLKPLTGDQVLAATGAVEDNVVLAGRNGHWAAAWRAGSQGMETIEVQSGASHWTVGPFAPGAGDDRPDLIFLDDTHLAVAFTTGTDPDNTGQATVPRLHAAVLDPSTPGLTESFALSPAAEPYATLPAVGESEPSLVLAADHLLVSWRSSALPGDRAGSELWSRRVPFVVNGNSVTLDPSHIEVPVVQKRELRVGDQDAFRMLGTALWPSGGTVSVWNDSSRSFGPTAGGTDVAVQFSPDFAEAPQPTTSFRVSADGKYYFVNLLRRNYPPPTANATFTGSAAQYSHYYEPAWAINGDDSQFFVTAPAGDLTSSSTITVDMGQYFSVGAVRPVYYFFGNNPAHRIRLATTPGNWTTVLPDTATLSYDETFSFDATAARYVEVTMAGGSPYGSMELLELFVYPSTQGPPPSTADGYDLAYLSTTTANSNAYPPQPNIWPAGGIFARIPSQTYPPYATGDATATVDLGAQYPLSKLSLSFYVGSNWATGGRVEVAAVPGAYSTVYDSGRGNVFGTFMAATEDFSFPEQLVRYVRVSDYFVPGVGVSGGILDSVQAFTTPASRTAYYPLSTDRNYFNVNLARRPMGDIQPTASVAYSNGALAYTFSALAQNPANVLDGDDMSFNWSATAGTLASATTTMTVDLGQVQSIGGVRQLYGNYWPLSTSLRVAPTSTGPWTQVLADTALPVNDLTSSFAPISARYVELTMKGTTSVAFVNLLELQVFPGSVTDPAPSSVSHLDRLYLTGMSINQNANMGQNGGPRVHSVQGATGYYVKNAAQGATGDGTITIDLAQQYSISEVCLSFFGNQTWPAGGKIDVDDGSGGWVTVFDSGHGSPLGVAPDGTQRIPFAPRLTRHVRLTGYFDPALGQGLLENVEVF